VVLMSTGLTVAFGGPTFQDILLRFQTDTSCLMRFVCQPGGRMGLVFMVERTGRRIIQHADGLMCPEHFNRVIEHWRQHARPDDLLVTNNPYFLDHLEPSLDTLLIVWNDRHVNFFDHQNYAIWTEERTIGEAVCSTTPKGILLEGTPR
jgi:hypothetical protein